MLLDSGQQNWFLLCRLAGKTWNRESRRRDESSTPTAVIPLSHIPRKFIHIHTEHSYTCIYSYSVWIYAIRSSLTTWKTIIGSFSVLLHMGINPQISVKDTPFEISRGGSGVCGGGSNFSCCFQHVFFVLWMKLNLIAFSLCHSFLIHIKCFTYREFPQRLQCRVMPSGFFDVVSL